jgi:hypothetical protein
MLATDEALTKLTTVPSEQEAAIIVAALSDEEIDACYVGETTASFRVGVPGQVHVYVSEIEFDHARQVLSTTRTASLDEEPYEYDLPRPMRHFAWLVLFLLLLLL